MQSQVNDGAMKPIKIAARYIRTSNATRWISFRGPLEFCVSVGFSHDADDPHHAATLKRMAEGELIQYVGFNYVLQGTGTYTGWDGQTHPLYPGVFFHILSHRPYRLIHQTKDFSECYIACPLHFYELLVQLNCIPGGCWWRDIGLHIPIVESFEALEREATQTHVSDSAFLRHLLSHCEYMYALDAKPTQQDEFIFKAREILNQDLDKKISIETVAKRMGLSHDRFGKVFRSALGISPKEYRITQRIEKACKLLMTKSIKLTANELGYESVYYFSRQFKGCTGKSPGAYVRQSRPVWIQNPIKTRDCIRKLVGH